MRKVDSQFGIGETTSKGVVRIYFTVNKIMLTLPIHTMNGKIQLLLSLTGVSIASNKPTPSTLQHALVLRSATEEMYNHSTKKLVNAAVRERTGPDTSDIQSAPIDSHVLVYRPEKYKWEVPFTLLDSQDETCFVPFIQLSAPRK